ncbi:DnaJ-domain-containing protein [Rhodofomes roseus]|uniref:DnaJ-domain-containing protein n=1 Tax=Rhodofomes roseus TaxID=34475 RepID=A0ABQ8KLI5_9APHY|nr:DnaJ-domain-containing protein [Rhodofomes roseus]KAH9838496.1 DnaJ-domain-containing protein [Rhodofomes roseus]
MSAEASSSRSARAKHPASAPPAGIDDVEKLLSREATAFQREIEVERILKAFKLNPYEILDLQQDASADDIKKKYRQLSLFIHPDKNPHARAPDAFELLKQAESQLSEKPKREEIDAVINQARIVLLKGMQLPTTTPDNDPKLKGLNPPWQEQFLAKAKELLIEEEVRRRKAIKMNLANEGLEAKKKEDEVTARKRKAEEDAQWEETREQRVGSWRSFAQGKSKKKKQKVAILG